MFDLMPQLRKGTGQTPKDGGCVIQVAAYLYNKEWRDDAPCVHRVLRAAAIRVNDLVDDVTRQRLYSLIPRLMNTAIEDERENKRVSVGLAVWSAEHVFHLVPERAKESARAAIQAAKDWVACPCERHQAVAAAADVAAYAAAYAAAVAAYAVADADAAAVAADVAADVAAYAVADADAARYSFLVGLIDEYDRLTERKYPQDIGAEQWLEVCKVMVDA